MSSGVGNLTMSESNFSKSSKNSAVGDQTLQSLIPNETLLGGDFRVDSLLGLGGMGQVYRGTQLSLNRTVALKILKPELSKSPSYLSRFEVEATAIAKLNHPNIVQIYTLGQHGSLRFIAMEYVEGTNLSVFLQSRGPLDLPTALSIMRQSCQGIGAAGDLGLVHRDLKPENLLLTDKGQVKVADFGLCWERVRGNQRDQAITEEGITLGTPLYMSPEQVRGGEIDHRSDLYSLGVTFYQMMTGNPPFRGPNGVTTALLHLNEEPVAPQVHRPDIPDAIDALILRLLAKDPNERFQSADEVGKALQQIETERQERSELVQGSVGLSSPLSSPLEASEPNTLYRSTNVVETVVSDPPNLVRTGFQLLGSLVLLGFVGGAILNNVVLFDAIERPSPAQKTGSIGWLDPTWESVPKLGSATDQLRYAQLAAPKEDRVPAFLAVSGYYLENRRVAMASHLQLTHELLMSGDSDGLQRLAIALESSPDSMTNTETLAAICRAGSAALSDRPEEAWKELTTNGVTPQYLDPGLAAVAVEVVAQVVGSTNADARVSSQWSSLREDLIDKLEIDRPVISRR